jgi:excisionase family DNA binding protein
MNDKLLYRIPEIAEHLSISRSKVYELLKSGELRSVHIDRSRLVRAQLRPGKWCASSSPLSVAS